VNPGDSRIFIKEFKVWSILFSHIVNLNSVFVLNPPFLTNPSTDEEFKDDKQVLLGEKEQ
jgi:hypothetical protein